MKNRSRFAILGAGLLLGGASVALVANAADLAATPASPAAAQQEQAGEQQDAATEIDSATETESATEAQDPAGGVQVGHQDVPGTPDQTGDNQD